MAASWLFLLTCSLSGAFLSSLLGIGGAIFIIPIILFFQKSVGLNLEMHQISSLTTLFVFVAGVVGFWAHGRHYKIEKKLVAHNRQLRIHRRARRRDGAILSAA